MLKIFLVTLFALQTLALPMPDEVDLSRSTQGFPTQTVSGHGCGGGVYDGVTPDRASFCKPYFPVSLEITGARKSFAKDKPSVLVILVRNTSDQPIELPRSTIKIEHVDKQLFLSFSVYSQPNLKGLKTVFAFGATTVPSSVVRVPPQQAVTYLLPFDRKAYATSNTEQVAVTVSVTTYELQQNKADPISNEVGYELTTKPFIVK